MGVEVRPLHERGGANLGVPGPGRLSTCLVADSFQPSTVLGGDELAKPNFEYQKRQKELEKKKKKEEKLQRKLEKKNAQPEDNPDNPDPSSEVKVPVPGETI